VVVGVVVIVVCKAERPMLALNRFTLACALMSGTIAFAQKPISDVPELPLADAIQIALANNRPVEISKLDITKSNWQVAATKSKRFPEINTYFFGSGNLTPAAFTFKKGIFPNGDLPPVPSKDVSIELSQAFTGYVFAQVAQPLTQLYKIKLAIREQELEVELAKAKYQGNRQSVVADVKQAYYAVLQTESALVAAEATVAGYKETDRVMLEYLSEESVLKSDSLEVKAKLAQAQYQVAELNDTLQTQKEKLNDLLGRDIDTPFRTQPVVAVSSEEIDLKLARQTALKQRPEIQEAEIDTHRAEYDRRIAKSAYIPDIGAAFHYTSPIGTQILPQNIASAGVEVKWEPFEWGERRDNVKQKEVAVSQSKYQLDETRSQVLIDVDNSFRKLSESRLTLQVARAARDAANEKLREVNNEFSKSVVLLRDVLDQQTAVANANHDYEQGLLAFWSAKAQFEKSLGEE
jgi:outer membrane protein TolC